MTRPQHPETEAALERAAALVDIDAPEAVRLAEAFLRSHAGDPRALAVLGAARRRGGDAVGAIFVLKDALARAPSASEVAYELALAEAAAGAGRRALRAMERALSLKPGLLNAWRALGDALLGAGDATTAGLAYARHVEATAKDPVLIRAAAALNENDFPVAERLLKDYLKAHPTDVVAIRMLAELAARIGRLSESENLLARAVELAPDFRPARHHLGIVQLRNGKPVEAAAIAESMLKTDADNPSLLALHAAALVRLGDFDRAIGRYDQVLRRHARQPKVWMSYGHALKTVGRRDEAISAYRKSLDLAPSLGESWWSLANLKTVRFDDADIAAMTGALGADDLETDDRLHLHFALGKALEDRGRYAEAFQHYDRGNQLREGQLDYDEAQMAQRIARQKALMTPAFFAARRGQGAAAQDPIFVLGMPRAGSTLVEQILASHSLIEGTMELPDIIAIAQRLGGKGGAYPAILERLTADDLRALGEEYIERTRVQRKTDKPLFVDKMPNNFLHVALIRLILPNAKIIDARRHPMACCFSNFKQHFAQGQGFSYGLARMGAFYREYVRLMQRFDEAAPGAVHRVIYERMVAEPEREVRALLDFVGVPFEPACLRFYENERPVRTASSEQVRQPIFTGGVDHWRHFEPWLGPLADALGDVLTAYPDVPPTA